MSHCDDCSGYEGSCLHCKYNGTWEYMGSAEDFKKLTKILKEARERREHFLRKKRHVPIKFGKNEKDPLLDIINRSNK